MTLGKAGPVVVRAVASDVDRFTAAEPAVRADRPDAVHSMRVATRRLRSVLRTYRKVFGRDMVDPLRSELTWFGGILGPARDAEVMAMRFEELIGDGPPELVIGPVADRLVAAQRARYDAGLARVHAELDGERYRNLRTALDAVAAGGTSTASATKPAAIVLTLGLSNEYRRLRNDIRVEFAAGTADRIAALHEVRKSAKRLRYAAEAATPALGDSAERVGQAAKALQSLLGDHRDAAEAQELIMSTVAEARAAGEDTFTYGLLHMSLEQAAHQAISGYPAALESLTVACAALDA